MSRFPSWVSVTLSSVRYFDCYSSCQVVIKQIPLTLTGHFTCTSANVIYCITCTYCKKLNIAETGRRIDDRFQENLATLKELIRMHPNQSLGTNHSKHRVVCGLSLHLGNSESCKTLEQEFIFQIGTLNFHSINEHFSIN